MSSLRRSSTLRKDIGKVKRKLGRTQTRKMRVSVQQTKRGRRKGY